jgi:hypothetical protein
MTELYFYSPIHLPGVNIRVIKPRDLMKGNGTWRAEGVVFCFLQFSLTNDD